MGQALHHFTDIQAPIKLTFDEMELEGSSDSIYEDSTSSSSSTVESSSSKESDDIDIDLDDGEGTVYKGAPSPSRGSRRSKCCLASWVVFFFLFSITFGSFLMLFFALASGMLDKPSLLLWTAVSFLVICVICALGFFAVKSNRQKKLFSFFAVTALIIFLTYFAITQVLLSIIFPTACIVANGQGEITIGDSNININSVHGRELQAQIPSCNLTALVDEAKQFFGCSLRKDISFFYGGWPNHYRKVDALTLDNNVFFRYPTCEGVSFLIHQLVHVWQFQKGMWYGGAGVGKLFKWLGEGPDQGDFGGTAGLIKAKAEGKNFTDFTFSQQAAIVSTYYSTRGSDEDEGKKVLREYAEYVLKDCVPVN